MKRAHAITPTRHFVCDHPCIHAMGGSSVPDTAAAATQHKHTALALLLVTEQKAPRGARG